MDRTILIEPRDPVIFRDGKPFTFGLPARSMDWPLPSAVIGAIRTRLGRLTPWEGDVPKVQRLQEIRHVGPFLATPAAGGVQLAFPAPADAVAYSAGETHVELCPLRPALLRDGEGTDLPGGLMPVMGGREGKPSEEVRFWSEEATRWWLKLAGQAAQVRAIHHRLMPHRQLPAPPRFRIE